MARARNKTASRWALGVIVAVVVVGGIALVTWAQKAHERAAYQASVSGPPCPAVVHAPAYVRPDALKTGAFQAASFGYLRGDMDCQTAPVGDMADHYAPFCTFDRPGYVQVADGGDKAAFVVVVGQAVLSRPPGDRWRCAVKPPPT